MFREDDNRVTAAAAAPAHESQSQAAPQETPKAGSQENQANHPQAAQEHAAVEQSAAHETPSQRTEEDPKPETSSATAPETALEPPAAAAQPGATQVHGQFHERAEANAAQSTTDAES